MIKVKVIVLVGFLLAFAAGLVAGMIRHKTDAGLASQSPTTGPTTRRVSFAQALGLTPEQDRKIHQLREEAFREAMREVEERRESLRRQRDESILPLLSPENRIVYETVMQHYQAAMTSVNRERPAAFDSQDEQIRQVLTAEQRVKFEEMLKKCAEERKRREMNRRGDEKATTRPATTEPSR